MIRPITIEAGFGSHVVWSLHQRYLILDFENNYLCVLFFFLQAVLVVICAAASIACFVYLAEEKK